MKFGSFRIMATIFPVLAVICLTIVLLYNRRWLSSGGPVVLTRLATGTTNFALIQIHQGLGSYDTGFCIDVSNRWEWFYLDHDTGYWADAKLEHKTQDGSVAVFRGRKHIGQFDPQKGFGVVTPNGLVFNPPIGQVEGELVSNWNARKYFP